MCLDKHETFWLNNREIWSYIRYIGQCFKMYYSHQLGVYSQYTGNVVILILKYYRII